MEAGPRNHGCLGPTELLLLLLPGAVVPDVAGDLQALERLFVSHHELWSSAIEAVAVLDCLMALAGTALAADGQMCRPKLLEPAADGAGLAEESA
jgi:hypothetical protein